MNNRVKYIDIAKGILIIFVLYGHVHWIFGGYKTVNDHLYLTTRNWMYSFHMPAFFIISGFFMKNSADVPFRRYLLKKARTILLPYFAFEIFYRAVFVILGLRTIRDACISLLKLEFYAKADWFLLSLFIGSLLYYALRKVESKLPWARYAALIALVAMLFYRPLNYYAAIMWRSGVALLFLLIGEMTGKKLEPKFRWQLLLIPPALSLAVNKFNGGVDIYYAKIGTPFLWLAGSICGTFLIIELSKIIQSSLLSCMGRHTLIILGSHDMIMRVLKRLFHPSFSTKNAMMYFVLVVFIEVIIVLGCDHIQKVSRGRFY